jgi:hypothetical protein
MTEPASSREPQAKSISSTDLTHFAQRLLASWRMSKKVLVLTAPDH